MRPRIPPPCASVRIRVSTEWRSHQVVEVTHDATGKTFGVFVHFGAVLLQVRRWCPDSLGSKAAREAAGAARRWQLVTGRPISSRTNSSTRLNRGDRAERHTNLKRVDAADYRDGVQGVRLIHPEREREEWGVMRCEHPPRPDLSEMHLSLFDLRLGKLPSARGCRSYCTAVLLYAWPAGPGFTVKRPIK